MREIFGEMAEQQKVQQTGMVEAMVQMQKDMVMVQVDFERVGETLICLREQAISEKKVMCAGRWVQQGLQLKGGLS